MSNDAISRSAAVKEIERIALQTGKDKVRTVARCANAIELLPALDAVPVVRCRECKHWGVPPYAYETEHVKCCEFGGYMIDENGYCSLGERGDARRNDENRVD